MSPLGQPRCLQQQEEAAARATATTDGYQLFQKEPCSDLSPRQLSVCKHVCVSSRMCLLCFTGSWKSVCVCVHKQNSSEEWLRITAAGIKVSHSQAKHQKESSHGPRGCNVEGRHRNAPGALWASLPEHLPTLIKMPVISLQSLTRFVH